MQLIHGPGYSDQERQAYKEIIFSNVVQSMKTILEAMDLLQIALGTEENRPNTIIITSLPTQLDQTSTMPAEIAKAVKLLWLDSGVLEAYACKKQYQLNDSAN